MYCAITSLIEYGACSEEFWPNDEELICEEPSTEAYDHAANFKITEAEFIETDLDLWRHTSEFDKFARVGKLIELTKI